MAGLAAALGGMFYRGTLYESDSWDDLIETGYYIGNPSPGRTPTSWAHLLNFFSPQFRLQIIFENAGNNGVWYRTTWGQYGAWTEWCKIH